MNRKQRRAARGAGSTSAFGSGAAAVGLAGAADLFHSAVAQHQAGALDEAERQYRRVLMLAPTHADSLHNLGLIALRRGDAKAAVDLIARAIKINDRVADYHYNIALAWRALDRMPEVASHLERTIALRGDYALAHLNLGNVRRLQGSIADAIACYERAIALSPDLAGAHVNLANVLFDEGRRDEALTHYEQVLAREPNHAEAHARLGGALLAQGNSELAIRHLERALALHPNLAGANEELAKAYMAAGKPEQAIYFLSRALERNDSIELKNYFAHCVKLVRFSADDGRFRKLVLRALTEAWSRPRALAGVCISLIGLNPVVNDLATRGNAAWPARLPAAELLNPSAVTTLARDELLCRLLECDPVTDLGLERLLTNLRCAMLDAAATPSVGDADLLVLCCAIARQCFVNEYVFSTTAAEADAAKRLQAGCEAALASGEPCPALWPAALGAYFPLHTLTGAEKLIERSWPQCVKELIVQQIEQPAQERRIAASLPVLTPIDGDVSRRVRQQYEESPYPRWVKSGPAERPPVFDLPEPAQRFDVLVAGCGTGLAVIEFARQMRQAHVLAIDLSRTSLGYAKRMAESYGAANIEFAQADITELGAIERQFDFIDCSGVLHHLADPWQGWRVLLSLLRSGGVMQVGLYSALARQSIVAARALIAEHGYRPFADDIRRCREHIIGSQDPLLKSVVQWEDFFTTSECRDLLFHVQEHRTTLPDIKDFLAANGLSLLRFNLDPLTLQRFAARFPDATAITDLDCWHAFEIEAPATFAAMYQFWVCKS
jgi:tetratricopeptide (TPR) repeat protein/2-polyprenyl-3-methyl-5-hydroxy-6-metoxy-1,4-benzoquinol methylase